MKIYVETPVKVEKGDFLVVDDVYEKGCHCGTKKYIVQLIKTTEEELLVQGHDKETKQAKDFLERTSCYA